VYGVDVIQGVSRGFTLVHPDDAADHQHAVEQAVDRGRGYTSSFRIIRPDTHQTVQLRERAGAIGGERTAPVILFGYALDMGAADRGPVPRRRMIADAIDALDRFDGALLTVRVDHSARSDRPCPPARAVDRSRNRNATDDATRGHPGCSGADRTGDASATQAE
jgi:hypothetical protein